MACIKQSGDVKPANVFLTPSKDSAVGEPCPSPPLSFPLSLPPSLPPSPSLLQRADTQGTREITGKVTAPKRHFLNLLHPFGMMNAE